MSKLTRQQQIFNDLNELLGYYAKSTKSETMAAQIGLLMGWLSRIASIDYSVQQELTARLKKIKNQNSSLEDTSKPPVPRP